MSNISFGVNILPKTNSVTIGNSETPWRIHADQINGYDAEDVLLPEVSSTDNGKVLKVVEGDWTASDAPSPVTMTGADGTNAGTAGYAPAPAATDNTKYLKGDGTWADVDALPAVTSSDNGKVLEVSNSEWTVGNEKIDKEYKADGAVDKNLSAKSWNGLTNFYGPYIWTDGENIYYSESSTQKVLDKSTSTWSSKIWNELTNFSGNKIWTDGDNFYYSYNADQYVLDKSTSTWSTKSWSGLTSIDGRYIWTCEENIYYSDGYAQYILDKSTSTWSTKTWTGLTRFYGDKIWNDGENIYLSDSTNQYVLDKSTSTWSAKSWSGLTNFYGSYIWTDDTNIYYSSSTNQYVLDKFTSTWSTKTWTGLTNFNGGNFIWTDGDNIYYSNDNYQYVFSRTYKNKLLLGQNGEFSPVPVSDIIPSVMTGADGANAGASGLVPAPAATDNTKYLKGNGTWADVPSPVTMTGANGTNAGTAGYVPTPTATDNTKYLKGDGTWAAVPSPVTMTGADGTNSGTAGYAPAPTATDNTKYLKGDGTWADVPSSSVMTGATASTAGTSGLVPAPASGQNIYFLKGNGTWDVPPGAKLITRTLDTVTNTSGSYTHSTTINDVTAEMKVVMIELGDPSVFHSVINISTADGSVTLSCSDVSGTSTAKVSMMFLSDSATVTSSEFDVLAARIGTLSNLHTTAKTNTVDAINETYDALSGITATTFYRQFWNSTNSVSVALSNNGRTYMIWTAGSSAGTSGAMMDSSYGSVINVSNGEYAILHKGSEITVSVANDTLTVSSSSNVKMAVIEL